MGGEVKAEGKSLKARTLFERETELESLFGFAEDAKAGRSGLLAIEGASGIGKTRLLGEGIALGTAAGVQVLSARSGELERSRETASGQMNGPISCSMNSAWPTGRATFRGSFRGARNSGWRLAAR